ncbi:efflux transporter outer membrane subunit [Adhaeribacter aquaticus]|uniref:efflux transporter outer membrane subunit n=1 Tax=Adhaeribacter aquaticus TaxID=299567 RepID=UPI000413D357|nr:efflux transporter outer membrane subunit [Adhaeribacter aquaticus]
MLINKYILNSLVSLILLSLVGACKVAPPVALPQTKQVPNSFGGATDSVSIGAISWKKFFTDPNLVNLIDTALQQNPDLQMAVQRIEMARANVMLSRGAFLPGIQGVASASVDRYGEYTMTGVGNYDTNKSPNINRDQRVTNPVQDYLVGLRSFWEVDLWGKLRNYKKAAYARFLASEKGRNLVQTALVANVASMYYELLALDNELEILDRNIELQQLAVELIQVQKAGGRATELAVQQFRAQLLNTRSLQAMKQQEIVAIENQLNSMLGRFPQPINRGLPLNQQVLPANLQVGIPVNLLSRRPDIQQAELELIAAKANVAAVRASFLPALTISPYIGFNAFKAPLLFDPASLAMGVLGGVTAPIFNQNILRSEYRRSAAGNREAFYGYQKALLTGYQEVLTSMRGIENYRRVADLKQQEVETLRSAVATSNDLFTAGYANYLEIITAQRGVLEAELVLTDTRKSIFLSSIDLYRALGGGWQ